MGFAAGYADTLYKTSSYPVIITDRDTVIAYAGTSKKECADKKVSSDIEEIMESRQLYTNKSGASPKTIVDGNEKINVSTCMPIVSEGDIIGSVVSVLPENSDHTPDETEIKLIQTAAAFLSKQLET